MSKALGSVPSTTKKKRKEKKLTRYGGTHLSSQLLGKQRQEGHKFKASTGKDSKILSKTKNKRAGERVTQVIQCEALGSIPSTKKKKK
jgi:hypothetical protein